MTARECEEKLDELNAESEALGDHNDRLLNEAAERGEAPELTAMAAAWTAMAAHDLAFNEFLSYA